MTDRRPDVIETSFANAVKGFVSHANSKNLEINTALMERAFNLWDFRKRFTLEDWIAAVREAQNGSESQL